MDEAQSMTPKQVAVIQEYQRLVNNLQNLGTKINTLANTPTSQVLDNLRVVERKTGLVFTLFKSSVWAILADLPGDGGENSAMADE